MIKHKKSKKMDPSSGVRHYRRSMGYYPTAKNSRDELDVYEKVHGRALNFLRNERINSLNSKEYLHDMQVFSWKEANELYAYASTQKALEKLLPTLEASQVYILTILLSLISEEAYGREQRTPRHQGEPHNYNRPRAPRPEESAKRQREV